MKPLRSIQELGTDVISRSPLLSKTFKNLTLRKDCKSRIFISGVHGYSIQPK